MSNQQADECAASIVEMFGSVCRARFAPDRPGTVVQLHSVDCAPAEFDTPAPLAAAAS
jgi:hypothetical protein